MANVKFPRKEFEKHIKLTQEVQDKISLFGTPLESLDKDEIEIEVFPNRPDLLSMQGFLRAFKAFLGKSQGLQKYKLNKPEKDYRVKIESSVKSVRPYTACAIVKGLKFDDEKIKEIIDLQEKLHNTLGRNRKKVAIGIYPLEKIKLPIKYEARKPSDIKFMPLESDREMTATQILQRHQTGRDYAHLLEDFDKYPVFVDANNKILSLPPVINSHETGKITDQTRDVFVECSGSDFQTLKKTLNIVITTLADMSGKIYQMDLDYKYLPGKTTTPDLKPEKMKVSLENTNKLLGLSLKESDLGKLFSKMGYHYQSGSVLIPAWRTDILHEVDLIEDLAIAYGYDKIIPEIPNVATTGSETEQSKKAVKISEILSGLNLTEISTYHLIKKEEAKKQRHSEKIELEDSKTDYKLLRTDLLTSALRIYGENKDQEYPQKIFEQGTVFSLDKENKTESGIIESEGLLIASSPGNFTEVKQILDYLTKMLDLSYTLKEADKQNLIPGRTAEIEINGKIAGYLGEISPDTLKAWYIKMPIAVIELNLSKVLA